MTVVRATLPGDSHVHSEWSWDAPHGSMEQACLTAVTLGLPAIVFTEHVDFTSRRMLVGTVPDWQADLVEDGILTPPSFDLAAYLKCLDDCRDRFPAISIGSGLELGEPHWHQDRVAETLSRARFDRILASAHLMRDEAGARVTVSAAFRSSPAPAVVRTYLTEVCALITEFDGFDVLAHIDYAVRSWPASAGPYQVADFSQDYRQVLALLAAKGKALEINTRVPLHRDIVRWWHDLKGPAITFASDAHRPDNVADGFKEAVAEAAGFAPSPDSLGLWVRR